MNSYEKLRAACTYLTKMKFYDAVQAFVDSTTMYDDTRMHIPTAIDTIHAFLVVMQRHSHRLCLDLLLITILEALRFFLPTVPVDHKVDGVPVMISGGHVEMVFQKESNVASIAWLETAMKKS